MCLLCIIIVVIVILFVGKSSKWIASIKDPRNREGVFCDSLDDFLNGGTPHFVAYNETMISTCSKEVKPLMASNHGKHQMWLKQPDFT